MKATADTWVFRNDDGQLEAVKVADMADLHLVRWLNYFRRRVLSHSPQVQSRVNADALIIDTIVTARAIIGELWRRGLMTTANTQFDQWQESVKAARDADKAAAVAKAERARLAVHVAEARARQADRAREVDALRVQVQSLQARVRPVTRRGKAEIKAAQYAAEMDARRRLAKRPERGARRIDLGDDDDSDV